MLRWGRPEAPEGGEVGGGAERWGMRGSTGR